MAGTTTERRVAARDASTTAFRRATMCVVAADLCDCVAVCGFQISERDCK